MSPTGFAKRLTRARRVDRPKPRRGEVSKKVDAELDGGARGNLVVQMDVTRRKRMLTPDAPLLADYLVLADKRDDIDRCLESWRRAASARSAGNTIRIPGTLAIVAVLAMGLITAIAVSVSGP
jgi:hypothetical protein